MGLFSWFKGKSEESATDAGIGESSDAAADASAQKQAVSCPQCGKEIQAPRRSCEQCHVLPASYDTIQGFGVVVISNERGDGDWWMEHGCIQAFMQVNPLLAEEMKNRYENRPEEPQVAYRCGVLETDKEIDNPLDWLDKAQELVTVTEDSILVVQHGMLKMELPSGFESLCGLLIVLVISEASNLRHPGDEPCPTYFLPLNHQVAP